MGAASGPTIVAIVAMDPLADGRVTTALSLRRSHPEIEIRVAGGRGAHGPALEAIGVTWVEGSAAAAANRAWTERCCHLLIVSGAVDFPDRAVDPALAMVANEQRVGTVSFFSDDAAFLTFPQPRLGELETPSIETDADTTTLRLRSTGPDLGSCPIPFAIGPVVLVTLNCLSAVGPLTEIDGSDSIEKALVDFSLAGRKRGFLSLLDPSTYCRGVVAGGAVVIDNQRFPGEPEATLVAEYGMRDSPLSIVHAAARAKVCGLRVLIDAARLGPREMGTQVATVALIQALARRDDIARVCVALAEELPTYATTLGDDPKVEARITPARDFSGFGRVDVAHRPFQPDSPFDMEACRSVADRTVITILDLIAYHAVSYQLAPENWATYREWLRQSIAQADAVVAPSHDVARQISLERLPVDAERLLVAELGTDHITGDEPGSPPEALLADLSDGDRDFLVVLGADYTHKNRDIAVRAHRELCRRGYRGALVMAGAQVHGSSRQFEDAASAPNQAIVVLGDISSPERNWLLRHASVVLYPTSGEGFGLIPFEAARFGTPTAFVGFGPLAELIGELPERGRDWSPFTLADAAGRLMADQDLADEQVRAIVEAGNRYTWDAGAAKLAGIYRAVLAKPPVAHVATPATATAITITNPVTTLAETAGQRQREESGARRSAHEKMRSLPSKLAVSARGLRDEVRRRR